MGINTFREVVDILDAAVSGPGTEVGPHTTPSGAISLGMNSSLRRCSDNRSWFSVTERTRI